MADPFGIGAGIVGVIGLTIQITQVIVRFGLDWKDAPTDAKSFISELGALKTVLSETHLNLISNPDFAAAFEDKSSVLLSQLGTSASPDTETKLLLGSCQRELKCLLDDLAK